MSNRWAGQFTFQTGDGSKDHTAYVLADYDPLTKKNTPNSSLFWWDKGRWAGQELQWDAATVCCSTTPRNEILILGVERQVARIENGSLAEEKSIPTHSIAPSEMRRSKTINGRAYVVGGHEIYRRENINQWKAVHSKLNPSLGDEPSFEALDGFSDDEIYVVGWSGSIWYFDGSFWQQCESPTRENLTSIECAEDGWVYICGSRGTVLKGRKDTWGFVEPRHHTRLFLGCPVVSGKTLSHV